MFESEWPPNSNFAPRDGGAASTHPSPPRSGQRRTTSRQSRRCLGRSSSITRHFIASRISWSRSIFPRRHSSAHLRDRRRLIRAGKLATPVHAEDSCDKSFRCCRPHRQSIFGPACGRSDHDNRCQGTGRAIFSLSIRRGLIAIGEDMVNLAYEAPVNTTISQIEEVERQLQASESGRNDTGFQLFGQALDAAVDGGTCLSARSKAVRTGDRITQPQLPHGRICSSRISSSLPAAQALGKTALATNIAYNVAKASGREALRRPYSNTRWRNRWGFFSLEMFHQATRNSHYCRANRNSIEQNPAAFEGGIAGGSKE